ncbi:ElyC/SanA/YdcF family protein [Algicella marina]|uniref:YdcF family protein n=1 Tax=Algicella marina TaxID=2683284 RepID=A0A6P1T1W6_9RHOB|nr:ElyC/SanA/YdcF family protein [Algicella marina]QHQ35755.1 YdcF family protein [Algicella marina]
MALDDAIGIVLVLANLMDADGRLNRETAARVELGHQLLGREEILFFIGWDYREDSDIAIADAMRAHGPDLAESRVMINRQSRDSVGDAILSRRDIEARFERYKLTVVSSDYHIDRLKHVFGRVYGSGKEIAFAAAASEAGQDVMASEQRSIEAFDRTFAGVESGDLPAFTARLLAKHPFYNGAVHPRMVLEPK